MNVKNVLRALARFTRAKEAVSALEYAIVVGVVVAGVGGAVVAFTNVVTTEISETGTAVGKVKVADGKSLTPAT